MLRIVAKRSLDAHWRKMQKVYAACAEAGVDIPDEVAEYFDKEGIPSEAEEITLRSGTGGGLHPCIRNFNSGIAIALEKLPPCTSYIVIYRD